MTQEEWRLGHERANRIYEVSFNGFESEEMYELIDEFYRNTTELEVLKIELEKERLIQELIEFKIDQLGFPDPTLTTTTETTTTTTTTEATTSERRRMQEAAPPPAGEAAATGAAAGGAHVHLEVNSDLYTDPLLDLFNAEIDVLTTEQLIEAEYYVLRYEQLDALIIH